MSVHETHDLRAVLTDCGLRPSPLRMAVLEMADEIAECQLDGPAVFRRLYERGQFVPMSSLYRVLNELDRLGLLQRASGRGWPRAFQSAADSGVGAQRI